MGILGSRSATGDRTKRRLPLPAWFLGLAVALTPAAAAAQSEPCQAFTVVSGSPGDVAALKDVIRRVVDAYRGNEKSVTRFLREFDATRFVSGFAALERSVQRDFDALRDREVLCRRGYLSVQGDVAVLESEWEKSGFAGGARVVRKGPVTFQLMRAGDTPAGATWKITGLRPARQPEHPSQVIFGAPSP